MTHKETFTQAFVEYADAYHAARPHGAPTNAGEERANWNYFKDCLIRNVDDPSLQKQAWDQLKSLEQGSMSVNEYLNMFKTY